MVIVGLFLEIIIHIICISVLVPLKTMRQRRRRVRSRNMYKGPMDKDNWGEG